MYFADNYPKKYHLIKKLAFTKVYNLRSSYQVTLLYSEKTSIFRLSRFFLSFIVEKVPQKGNQSELRGSSSSSGTWFNEAHAHLSKKPYFGRATKSWL